MATYKAAVKVAGVTVQIEAETDRELFETLAHLQALDDASEGQDVRFMFRVGTRKSDNKKFKYYGFIRRTDSAELTLGQRNELSNPEQVLFAYDRPNGDSGYRGSDKYRGFVSAGKRAEDFEDDGPAPVQTNAHRGGNSQSRQPESMAARDTGRGDRFSGR